MPDAYASFAVEFEADLSGVQAGLAGGLSMARLYGNQYGSNFASGMTEGFGNLSGGLNMLQGLRGQFASTAQGLSEIFGMKAGSEMAYFRRQLVGMTGDAATAQKTLDGLVKIANETSYGNMDIFQLATNALGSGTSAQDLIPQTGNLLDAAAGIGINDPAVFRRFSRNLFDIRGKEGEASQRDVNELYRQAPQFVFQAAKVMGTNAQGAREQINGMSGSDLYNLIVKIGDANKGRAAREGMADPFVAAANALDQFNTAMAPTGELVNRVITPLIGAGGALLSGFAQLNHSGVPGFALALGTTIGVYRIYQATIGRTTLALNALAMAATRASGGQAIGAGASLATGAAGSAGIGAILSRLGVPALIGALAYGAADWASSSLSQQGGLAGRVGAGGQAGLKQMFDVMHGGWWMSPVKAFEAFRDYKGPAQDNPMGQAAKDLKEAAGTLKDAAADGYGYGKRGKATLSSIEAGYALLGAERLGIA